MTGKEKDGVAAITGIVKALGVFQSKCPAIKKEKTAGSGKFQYKYGSLPHILEAIKPHMKEAGLAFTQPIVTREDKMFIITTVYEIKTGESIVSDMELPNIKFQGMNELQSMGSAITYLRRYAIMSILGIVTEDDDNDAAGKTEKKTEPQVAAKTTAAPDLPFLNPDVDGKPNPKWNQALKYLADGGKIAVIKNKYRIGKNNEERLLNEAMTFDDLPFTRKDTEDAEILSTEGADNNALDKALANGEVKPGESNVLFDEQGDKEPTPQG